MNTHHETSVVRGSALAKPRGPSWSRAAGLLLLVAPFAVVSAVSGCTLIAGIEHRKDDGKNSQYDTVDKESDLPTTTECVDYCDLVLENCTDENAVYKTRTTCINTCNALSTAGEGEGLGNSIACRTDRARAAKSSPDEECAAAGPNGDNGACGSSCEAWCTMLSSECPDEYAGLLDCPTACSALPVSGHFSLTGNYTGETVECRLIHLGAVGAEKDTSVHCGHGKYIPTETCGPLPEEEPTCERYCDVNLINCEDFEVYESRDQCLAACAALPLGEYSDKEENTVGCRIYHSKNAAGVPQTHCTHGGPSGNGHCGVYSVDEEGFTGNCESYCYLFKAACGDEFEAEGYANIKDCAEQCSETFENNGAKNDVPYTVEDAVGDTLQCRTHQAVKILAGESASCDSVIPSGTCE